MTEYDNSYDDDDMLRCPGCNKPIKQLLDDTIISKKYERTKIVKYMWHMSCYSKKIIDDWYEVVK